MNQLEENNFNGICAANDSQRSLAVMHLSMFMDLEPGQIDMLSKTTAGSAVNDNFCRSIGCKKYECIGVVGSKLTFEGISQINQLFDILLQPENICQQGLFRKSGSISRQEQLIKHLHMMNHWINNLGNTKFSVHDCCSVIKQFVRMLPEPLLTIELLPLFQALALNLATSSGSSEKLLTALQILCFLLPAENYKLLMNIISVLFKVAGHSNENLMTSEILGVLWAPVMIAVDKWANCARYATKAAKLTSFMINQFERLFCLPDSLVNDLKVLTEDNSSSSAPSDPTEVKTLMRFADAVVSSENEQKLHTETAVAQLFAYVHSMPECAERRRMLLKLRQQQRSNIKRPQRQSQSPVVGLANSIKKRIFSSSTKRRQSLTNQSSQMTPFLQRNDCIIPNANLDLSLDVQTDDYSSLTSPRNRKPLVASNLVSKLLQNDSHCNITRF